MSNYYCLQTIQIMINNVLFLKSVELLLVQDLIALVAFTNYPNLVILQVPIILSHEFEGGFQMSSIILSDKLKKILPNKKLFLTIIIFLLAITVGSFVALANENTVQVKAEILNVRYGPGLSHEVLTEVKENDRLHVLGEENKWYKVRLPNEQIGWVASWLVDNNKLLSKDHHFIRVTSPSVNIRQFANAESQILGVVQENTELQVLYEDGSWSQILYMGQVAWIHSNYTEKIDSSGEKEINSDSYSVVKTGNQRTNIRSGPSLESEVIYLAEAGESFNYLETTDNWYHVLIDGNRQGYISNTVASIEDKRAEATIPSASPTEQRSEKVSSLAEATIVIDPGHGGKDPGAISADKSIYEKNLALNTSLLLKKRLEDAGSNVILTRENDVYVSLDDRVAISHQHQADLFISLHYDAVEDANSVSGTTSYYQFENNLELAQMINKYLSTNGPLPNNGVRLANYQVLRDNKQPAVLLELGYMNHGTDTQVIDTPFYQSTIVEAIYQALGEFYGH